VKESVGVSKRRHFGHRFTVTQQVHVLKLREVKKLKRNIDLIWYLLNRESTFEFQRNLCTFPATMTKQPTGFRGTLRVLYFVDRAY
jgi:hypothetical protein